MGILVKHLEAEDSQAAGEQADGSDDKGGLLVHLFSDHATELGDLNSSNWREKWNSIRWGGGTRIMAAWEAAQDDYLEEFGEVPALDRPVLLTLVITDGEAQDADQFIQVLEQANAQRKFCVAVLGFGPDHDSTLGAYKAVEATNGKDVRVVSFRRRDGPGVDRGRPDHAGRLANPLAALDGFEADAEGDELARRRAARGAALCGATTSTPTFSPWCREPLKRSAPLLISVC
jgi:hypothetical protein